MTKIAKLFTISCAAFIINTLSLGWDAKVEAAPKFGISGTLAKVGDGSLRAPGGNVLATDGSSFYVANTGYSSTSGEYLVKLTLSRDGGMTWRPSIPVATSDFGFTGFTSISVSGNAAQPGQTLVHVVWEQLEPELSDSPIGIYYSWADDANLNNIWDSAFSLPVCINGEIPAEATSPRTSLTTSPDGDVHVIFQGVDGRLYYTTSENNTEEFTLPSMLPGIPTEWGDIESALDKTGTLHVAYPTSDESLTQFGLEYTKKPAGSNAWTTPVVVEPLTVQNDGFTTITAYNPKRIYIGKHNYEDIIVYRTRNGGETWRKTTVFDGTDTTTPTQHLSLSVSDDHNLLVASGFRVYTSDGEWLRRETMAFTSRNRGRSWSDGIVIPDVTSPSVKFDADGKAGIVFKGANDFSGGIYFTKQR